MSILSVRSVTKVFDGKRAVQGLSLEVGPGEIFGLLGPNGAGKTTLLRMVMDILKPDEGTISIFGRPLDPAGKDRIGYLPEERGLYQRVRVGELLQYLAELKGLAPAAARARIERGLRRVDLGDAAGKKVRELSKGMQQKVQLVATLLPEPDLLILDEPFSGLDPVNRLLALELLEERVRAGSSLVLSTHILEQAEALCERVLLVNGGRALLEGRVRDLKEQRGEGAVLLTHADELPAVEGALRVTPLGVGPDGRRSKVHLRPGTPPDRFLAEVLHAGARVTHFERALPTLNEIFIAAVREDGPAGPSAAPPAVLSPHAAHAATPPSPPLAS
ncbi:MAG: ATP-binding cassette domain-containing protein [Planctomycetes bacterium]|nr:ATP-binding cassette domain-containing protein [Planctomycetota bacterium]